MSDKLIKLLLKAITFIPGIVGIANLDFTKTPNKLKEESWFKGVKVDSSLNIPEISVAIVVDKDINAKIIAKELGSSITQILQKEQLPKAKVHVYVRGVE